MDWLAKISRNLGLMVHNMKHPDSATTRTTQVSRTVEEKQVDPVTTLRRTTIEEIEIRPGQKKNDAADQHDDH